MTQTPSDKKDMAKTLVVHGIIHCIIGVSLLIGAIALAEEAKKKPTP